MNSNNWQLATKISVSTKPDQAQVWKGRQFTECSTPLKTNADYTERILLGMPLTQANEAQRHAAPFGVCVDDSARAFAPPKSRPIPASHWQWWRHKPGVLPQDFCGLIERHYDWCEKRAFESGYALERQKAHRALAVSYFDAGEPG